MTFEHLKDTMPRDECVESDLVVRGRIAAEGPAARIENFAYEDHVRIA